MPGRADVGPFTDDPFDDGDPALLLAALAYASRGFFIFPCLPDKTPNAAIMPKVPKGEGGYKLATADPATIRRWWTAAPGALIGVACGASGLVVVDLDVKHPPVDGFVSWQALMLAENFDDDTPHAETPTGGGHVYFAAPKGVTIPNSSGRLGDGVDVRGNNGYVIGPESATPEGRYAWLPGHGLDDLPIAPLPASLVELLRRPEPKPRPAAAAKTIPAGAKVSAYARKAFEEEIGKLAATTEGRRNTQLNEAAVKLGGLVAGGELDQASVEDALRETARAIGLEETETEKTLRSGMEAGMAKPRTAPESTKPRRGVRPTREASDELPSARDREAVAERPDEKAKEAEPRPPTCKAVGIGGMRTMTADTKYLWPNVMVRGQCTALGGDWYEGKSWVGLSIAQTVVMGGNWPDGSPWEGDPGRVLWYEAEGRHGIQLARLGGMGIPDDARFFFVAPPERTYYLDVPKDLAEIIAQARDVRPDLFVVDSWARAIRGKENEAEVRHIFGALQAMATELGCAMLTMHNLRKRSVTDLRGKFDFDRLRGSSAVAAGAVSLLGVDRPDPQNREARRLTIGKCTPAPKLPEPLGFRITEGKVVWGDAPEVKAQVSAFDEAVLFLQDTLAEGAVIGSDLLELAKTKGIAPRTLERARDALGVKSRPGRDGKYWVGFGDEKP